MKRLMLIVCLSGLVVAGCGQTSSSPTPPTKLKAVVSWKPAADNVQTFELYKNGRLLFSAPVSINSFDDPDITPGTKYCYDVVVVDGDLQSPPSNTVCVTL